MKAICALTGSRLPEQLRFLEPQTSVRVPQAHSNIASVRLTPVTANDVKRFITSEDKRSLAVESGHGIDHKDVISPAELTPKEKSERKQHKKTSKKKSGSKSTIVRWNVQPAQGNQKGQQRKDLQYAVRQSVYWYLAAQFTNQLKEKEEMKYNRILILRSFFKQFLAGKMPNQEKSTQQTYDLWVSYIAGSVKSHDHGKDEQKKEIVRQHVQAITHQLGRLSIVLRVSGKAQTRELVCQSLLLGRCQSVRQCGSLQLWHRAVHRAAGSSRQVQPTV